MFFIDQYKLSKRNIKLGSYIIATLALGALGGVLFKNLHMPLAWMLGSMVFTTIASLAGAPLLASDKLRTLVIPILGVMLGSAFSPSIISKVHLWLPSLAIMVIYVTIVAGSVGFFLHRFIKIDIATSYFSATPGGLATMVILGVKKGGNEQTIALTHSVRILLTVLIIPLWLQFFEEDSISPVINFTILSEFSLKDGFILTLCGVVGFYIGKLINLPSYQLLGPMIVSTLIHLFGISGANPPTEIINIAQVIIGSGIGARFAGISILHVSKVLISAIATTIYIISLAALISWGLAIITGLPFQALWIAFAPGGLAEMSLLSLSMGIDPAFVSTHHLLRVSFMIVLAPIVFKIFEK